jgi:hypothetical protein
MNIVDYRLGTGYLVVYHVYGASYRPFNHKCHHLTNVSCIFKVFVHKNCYLVMDSNSYRTHCKKITVILRSVF